MLLAAAMALSVYLASRQLGFGALSPSQKADLAGLALTWSLGILSDEPDVEKTAISG